MPAYPKSFVVTAPNGDQYEATKTGPSEAWHIGHPEGDVRIHGSASEVRAKIKKLIAAKSA